MSYRADGTRTDYKVCPYCGSTLDPGERCECQERKETEDKEKRNRDFYYELLEEVYSV